MRSPPRFSGTRPATAPVRVTKVLVLSLTDTTTCGSIALSRKPASMAAATWAGVLPAALTWPT
jgi:hypothetical protein